MVSQKVNTAGFELDYSVPSSIEEYNSLAPARKNPVLEDAIWNILYRNVFNKFRDRFSEALEATTGVKRINSGTDDEPVWESDGKFQKRVFVQWAKNQNLDPAAKATRDAYQAAHQGLAQICLTGGEYSYTNEKGESIGVKLEAIKFDVSEQERGAGGPPLAKTYIGWATEAVNTDGGVALATVLGKISTKFGMNLNTTLVDTGNAEADKAANIKLLATAIAANEKRKRDIESAKAKAGYLSGALEE